MMRSILTILIGAISVTLAEARTRIIVLPRDTATIPVDLKKQLAESVVNLPGGDKLLVYTVDPVSQIASITRPTDPSLNKARVNAMLATQFKPVADFLATAPANPGAEPPGNVAILSVVTDLGRDVLPSLPEKGADVLLIGSWLHRDHRDARSAMVERAVPSDATLRAPRGEWPYSVVGAEQRLAHSTLFFCWPDGANAFENARHEERVRRWWSLWTTAQAGGVGVMSFDLKTCFARFNAGETSGQPVYLPQRDGKPEMQRVFELIPLMLPASFETPGIYFLKDDMPVSRTPPSATRGIAWIGIKWAETTCDFDLYARGGPTSPWLFFANGKTVEGTFFRDWTGAPGEGQYEYIAFSKEIDLATADVSVNLYACQAATPPEGKVRLWFAAKVFEAAFKFSARTGNKGAQPMTGGQWVRLDLRKIVGLIRE